MEFNIVQKKGGNDFAESMHKSYTIYLNNVYVFKAIKRHLLRLIIYKLLIFFGVN